MNRSEYQEYLASRKWALKREAVRERSAGQCERCCARPMNAVHHPTYEHVGDEPLEDLQAICDPCHEYLSGKSNDDPKKCPGRDVKVYLAGPITGSRWRDDLLVGRVGYSEGRPNNFVSPDPADDWPIARQGLIGGFDFVGPWFVDTWGGHGAALEADSHGASTDESDVEATRFDVWRKCVNSIDRCDVVFVWLPATTCVPAGTIWEMGVAFGYRKPIRLAWSTSLEQSSHGSNFRLDDYWLARKTAKHLGPADSVVEAWDRFIADWLKLNRRRS